MPSKREIKTEGLGMTEFDATAGSAGLGGPSSDSTQYGRHDYGLQGALRFQLHKS